MVLKLHKCFSPLTHSTTSTTTEGIGAPQNQPTQSEQELHQLLDFIDHQLQCRKAVEQAPYQSTNLGRHCVTEKSCLDNDIVMCTQCQLCKSQQTPSMLVLPNHEESITHLQLQRAEQHTQETASHQGRSMLMMCKEGPPVKVTLRYIVTKPRTMQLS